MFLGQLASLESTYIYSKMSFSNIYVNGEINADRDRSGNVKENVPKEFA